MCPTMLHHSPKKCEVSCHRCRNVGFAHQEWNRGNRPSAHRPVQVLFGTGTKGIVWYEKTQDRAPVNDKAVVCSKLSKGFFLQLLLILGARFSRHCAFRQCLSVSFVLSLIYSFKQWQPHSKTMAHKLRVELTSIIMQIWGKKSPIVTHSSKFLPPAVLDIQVNKLPASRKYSDLPPQDPPLYNQALYDLWRHIKIAYSCVSHCCLCLHYRSLFFTWASACISTVSALSPPCLLHRGSINSKHFKGIHFKHFQ